MTVEAGGVGVVAADEVLGLAGADDVRRYLDAVVLAATARLAAADEGVSTQRVLDAVLSEAAFEPRRLPTSSGLAFVVGGRHLLPAASLGEEYSGYALRTRLDQLRPAPTNVTGAADPVGEWASSAPSNPGSLDELPDRLGPRGHHVAGQLELLARLGHVTWHWGDGDFHVGWAGTGHRFNLSNVEHLTLALSEAAGVTWVPGGSPSVASAQAVMATVAREMAGDSLSPEDAARLDQGAVDVALARSSNRWDLARLGAGDTRLGRPGESLIVTGVVVDVGRLERYVGPRQPADVLLDFAPATIQFFSTATWAMGLCVGETVTVRGLVRPHRDTDDWTRLKNPSLLERAPIPLPRRR